jgi:pimeloyl-ACP methyl ester carboxylesterase
VLIVPGYGMNASIFAYHPTDQSLCQTLSHAGLDVWTVDLRGQGVARREVYPPYGIAELALDDLPLAIDYVLHATGATELTLVGCSLGTALAFSYVAHRGDSKIASIVTMAGLVTWRTIHPLLRAAFVSSRAIAQVPMRGTAKLAGAALPLARAGILSSTWVGAYINPQTTKLHDREALVRTIEDPHPCLNREMALWMRRKSLLVRGVDVSRSLLQYRKPLFSAIALQDGVVTPETARHVFLRAGSTRKQCVEVGTREQPVAHADLFLGTGMQRQVFEPIARFLSTTVA